MFAELLVLLVLAGTCTAILVVKVLAPVKSPADATRDYLEAIKTGDTSTAFDLLCRSSRKGLTRAQFAAGVADERRTNGAVIRSRVVATFVESGGTARARYTLTTTKRVGTVEALLHREGGDWKLCDFREVGPSTPN